MSSIVKAKWVSQTTAPVVIPMTVQPEAEKSSEGQPVLNPETAESKIDHDDSVEAMHAANELMKEAIRASQEIKEKSQETVIRKGFPRAMQQGMKKAFGMVARRAFRLA